MIELLTTEELSHKLQLAPSTIRRWVRANRIPAIRVTAKVIRFDYSDVCEALRDGSDRSGEPAAEGGHHVGPH